MLVMGIETSCDETSVAVVRDSVILANEIYTQEIHTSFGGVVPEIASREHIKKISLLYESALEKSGTKPHDFDLICVTDRPGLAGALLIGISFGLGLHTALHIDIIGVHHLAGHIAAVALEWDVPAPFLALVVSGGHTSLYMVRDFYEYSLRGQTIDDAAGEAFDKVGKLLGFSYPAGRDIERCASEYEGDDRIHFPVAKIDAYEGYNFSFSGLKTAVKYYAEKLSSSELEKQKPRICYSFQEAVVDSLIYNIGRALADEKSAFPIAVVGGVACNTRLRKKITESFPHHHVFFPSPKLCTDNAAMIAQAGMKLYARGVRRMPGMEPTSKISLKG
ncbi:MAG: tRNA (adenosine(37)-N6)-threonylcarbamoyltransferase complex transferase subunit TsaD [Fibrobacterota bacterium]